MRYAVLYRRRWRLLRCLLGEWGFFAGCRTVESLSRLVASAERRYGPENVWEGIRTCCVPARRPGHE
jgi:hypothetical protein